MYPSVCLCIRYLDKKQQILSYFLWKQRDYLHSFDLISLFKSDIVISKTRNKINRHKKCPTFLSSIQPLNMYYELLFQFIISFKGG